MPGVSTCHLPLSPTHRVDPEGCSSVVAVGCSNITHLKLVMELMLSSGCQGVTPCPPGFAAPWGCCQGLDVVGQAWEGREGPHGGPGRVSVGGDPMDVPCSPSEERGGVSGCSRMFPKSSSPRGRSRSAAAEGRAPARGYPVPSHRSRLSRSLCPAGLRGSGDRGDDGSARVIPALHLQHPLRHGHLEQAAAAGRELPVGRY